MSCSCSSNIKNSTVYEDSYEGSLRCDETVIDVDESSKELLACFQCLEKHVSSSVVLYREYVEDNARQIERLLCIGNLSCAEGHASALGMDELRDKIRGARKQFQSEGRADMDALLTALMEQRESEH